MYIMLDLLFSRNKPRRSTSFKLHFVFPLHKLHISPFMFHQKASHRSSAPLVVMMAAIKTNNLLSPFIQMLSLTVKIAFSAH